MRMYYQINNAEHINKIYGDIPTDASGLSAIPYSFGWVNKYGPKPFGLAMPAHVSEYARSAYQIPNSSILSFPIPSFPNSITNVTNARITHGPVNAVYEIEISGVKNDNSSNKGRCVSCDGLNGKYIIHLDRNSVLFESLYGGLIWSSRLGRLDKPAIPCDRDALSMFFDVNSITGSGDLKVTLIRINFVNQDGASNEELHPIVFRKYLGNFNFNNISFFDKQLYMLEGEHELFPHPDYSGYYYSVDQDGDTNIGTTQSDETKGDYWCDYTSARVFVRPYKSTFYDPKNTLLAFSSGDYYRLPIRGFGVFDINPNYCLETPDYFANSYQIFSSGTGENPPTQWYLRILNCSGLDNTVGSTSCNEFYSQGMKIRDRSYADNSFQFGLLDFTYPVEISGAGIIRDQFVWWPGISYTFPSKNPNRASYDVDPNLNFYNISDFGCSGNYDKVITGLCNNFIQMDINYQRLGLVSKADAYLYFGAADINSGTLKFKVHSKAFKKQICSDISGVRCLLPNTNAIIGIHDCYSSGFWSTGWQLLDTSGVGTLDSSNSFIESERDISNYCHFDNAQVMLEPFRPAVPAKKMECVICSGYLRPQTATMTVTILGSGVENIFIMNDNVDNNDFCTWGTNPADNPLLNPPFFPGLGFTPFFDGREISRNRNEVIMIANTPIFVLPSGTLMDVIVSGINTGGVYNFHMNCNNKMIGSGLSSDDNEWRLVEIQFSDFINILDLL